MKRHMKRQVVPKNWPVNRKGTTFVVKATSNLRTGIPVLVAMRDILKVANSRKEVKRAIYEKHLSLNNKPIKEERQAVVLFDVLKISPTKKQYKLILTEKGKFTLMEIPEKESLSKVSKVVNKKILKGKKSQLNLSDGRNYLSEIKCNTNDSVIIDFKENKIKECLPLREKAKVFIFAGKHSGKTGTIEKLKLERKMASIKTEQNKLNVLIKQLIVIE